MQFNRKHLTTMALALAAFAAPGLLAADTAAADLVNTGGEVIGKATFEQTPTGVLMYVAVIGLPPGPHGIHLHAAGSCTPDFKQATGHINPGPGGARATQPRLDPRPAITGSQRPRLASFHVQCALHHGSRVLHFRRPGVDQRDQLGQRRRTLGQPAPVDTAGQATSSCGT